MAGREELGMVDVSGKKPVLREAVAEGVIRLTPRGFAVFREGFTEKGHLETIASIAALNAVKKTPEIVLHAHPIPVESVKTRFEILEDRGAVRVVVKVRTTAKTGVEMEALAGVMAALLAIWDTLKKYEKDEKGQYPGTVIESVRVVSKRKEE